MIYWNGWGAVKCLNQPKPLNHSIFVWKWNTGRRPTIISSQPPPKTRCGDRFRAHNPISTSPTIHYTNNDRLEGLRCHEVPNSTQNIFHLGVKGRGLLPKLSPPATHKPGCGDGHVWRIPISTLHKHSSYLQWYIGMVGMLWNAWISQSHSILVWKWNILNKSQLSSQPRPKTRRCGDHFRAHNPISPSPTIHYTSMID